MVLIRPNRKLNNNTKGTVYSNKLATAQAAKAFLYSYKTLSIPE